MASGSSGKARDECREKESEMAKKIFLTQGFYATVDDEDFDYLSHYNWHAMVQKRSDGSDRVYAMRRVKTGGKSKPILMHRVIVQASEGSIWDHIDGDTLNNQKLNLRSVTCSQNCLNRPPTYSVAGKTVASMFRGVTDSGQNRKKWKAQICINRKVIHLGHYESEIEAALAYDIAAIRLHGRYAHTNF